MRLDAELARRAFEALDTPLSLEQRVVLRLPHRRRQHRRGGHQRRRPPRRRPARLHARGLRRRRPDAAARRARPAAGARGSSSRRTPACSRPWGCSAPTSSTTSSRSAYVVLSADSAAPAIEDGLRADGARSCASGRRGRGTAWPCAAASTGGCSARAGRRRSSRSATEPITAETMPRDGRALPRRVRAPLRQPLPRRAGAGRHLPRAARRAGRQGRARARGPTATATRPCRRARSSCATSATTPLAGRRVRARAAGGRRDASTGRRSSARRCRPRSSCPAQVAEIGRFGEIVIEQAGRMIRDLGDDEFAERYGCDRFTATVLANRFDYVVEHMCSRLLTAAFSPILRDFYDFAGDASPGRRPSDYATPAMSNTIVLFTGTMTDSVRNTIEEYGPERLRAGRRHRRQRPLPDRHPRQRHAVHAPGLPRRRARRLRQPQGPPARHGRRGPRRVQRARSAPSTRTASSSRRAPLYNAGEPVRRPGA